jgi:hypothetical protein
MGQRDYAGVMAGKLQLDPDVAAAFDAGSPDALHGPTPDQTEPVGIDMGVTSHPAHRLGKPPAWLDPDRMGPVFGHYAEDASLEHRLNQTLKLPTDFLGRNAGKPVHRGWGKNDAGAGLTRGDWQIGGKPSMSTSDRFDSPGTRDRAEREDRDAVDAQHRGESAPDPAGDLLRGGHP